MKFADQEWPDTVYVAGLQAVCDYKYFLFNGETPMRVTVTPSKKVILADLPSYYTRSIARNNYFATLLDGNNCDAKEISKEEFYHRCDECAALWNSEHTKACGGNGEADYEMREEKDRFAKEANTQIGIGDQDDGRVVKFVDQEWPDTVYIAGLQVVCDYKYFLFNGETPIRVTVTPDKKRILSDAPNYYTRGLEQNRNYLALMLDGNNHGAQEISREEFCRRCDEYMAHWTQERIKEHEERVAADRQNSDKVRDEMIRLANEANAKIGMGDQDGRK